MRILIRTSRWAIWARRLGGVAVPLVVISVALHRLRLITSDLFVNAVTAAAVVALLAVVASVVALARIWQSGDHGWGKALLGLFFGLFCLAPFVWYGNLAAKYPPVTDIATTTRGLLPLVFEPGTAAMPPPRVLSKAQASALFPNAETRSYPLGQAQTFALVVQLIDDNGWDVRMVREPNAALDPALINAQIMTIPGWREEIVVRVTGDAASAKVDMRSASLNARHDFGANGLRIEQFLADLDTAVTSWLRDNPNLNLPETEAAEALPAPAPS
ncbi:MAG: DUF1499 domain-containing protein [Devosia sp.]